jgi:transposase
LVEAVPHGHWHAATFAGGLRADGFVAPVVTAGAVNGGLFRAYVERQSAPALRPGVVAVTGALGSPEVAGARAAIEAAGGRLLYRPPDSPGLNPTGNAFRKLRRLLRAAAERTVGGPWRRIGRLLDEFRPAERRNYFRHCGYTATAT